MTFKMSQDNCSKTYSSQEYYTGYITDSNQDTIFGITMQCPKPKIGLYTDFYIYQVDISSSRGFDLYEYYQKISNSETEIESINNENKYLFSRTPQILLIEQKEGVDFVTIIKSKMKNARIHLPRPNYEFLIKNNKHLSLVTGKYDLKYKKYKNKYLELKNKISI
jgi:hypothetical protein